MSNTVALEFAGDATKLARAGKQAEDAIKGVGSAATSASDDFKKGAKESTGFTDRVGKLGAGVTGMTDAIDSAGAAVQALSDIQQAGRERAMRLARANADVEQAMIDGKQAAVDLMQAQEDLNQSQLDGKQAAVDLEQAEIDARQAKLDAKTAQEEYNKAVKEHGVGSAEAMQAQIDLTQATADLNQARLDGEQAAADARQATLDGTQATVDATQAVRDGKDAQLNLNDAMAEANPTGLQKWAENIQLVTPLLSAVVGVLALVTAAQWAWNAAQAASPTTWIILGIVALVAAIVLLVKNWDWVKAKGQAAWRGIQNAASDAWGWIRSIPGKLRSAFAPVASFLFAPFRAAFNMVASAWNATIGRLHWTVPGWVPGIGGASISAPSLPHFHQGGTVPGPPGAEVLAVLQGGEKVTSRAGTVGADGGWVAIHGDAVIDALIQAIAGRVGRTGRAAQLGIRFANG